MAYKTSELEAKALEVIQKNRLVFIHEVASFMNISRQTFYTYGLDKLDSIKDALDLNKETIKAGLRKKWYESDNATVQIALYKLIGTDEESDRINSQKIKNNIEVTEDTQKAVKTFMQMITDEPE